MTDEQEIVTYEQWWSIAVGEMGMAPEVFDSMTVAHFVYAVAGYRRKEMGRMKEEWERIRWATYNVMRMDMTKDVGLRELLPLPWDEVGSNRSARGEDVECRKRVAREMMKMVNNK